MTINNENDTFTEGQEVWIKGKIETRSHIDYNVWLIKIEDGSYTRVPEEAIYTSSRIANDHAASVLQNNEDLTLDEKMKIMYTITDQNAKLNEGNECWVRATYVGKAFIHNESCVKIETPGLVERTSYLDVKDKDICFTKPNRTRKFKKRDKVKPVERDGRIPYLGDGFRLGEIYEVSEDEDEDGHVWIYNATNAIYIGISWIFLDLVEQKYFIDRSAPEFRSFVINYGTPTDYKFVAKLHIDHFTLEEAQEFCDKLNKK